MRKLLYLTVSVILFGFLLCCNKKGTDSETNGTDNGSVALSWLSTEGNRIVNDQGEVMILRGVNRSGLEYNKSGEGISEAEIDFICSNCGQVLDTEDLDTLLVPNHLR